MKENYELSTTVGTGGFSVVRLGKCRKTGDKVSGLLCCMCVC